MTKESELLVSMKWGFRCTFNSTYNVDLIMTFKKLFIS